MPELPEKLTSPYQPDQTEGRIYEMWEKSGYFNPDNLPNSPTEPFTIMMPPPNVTGILHMGHAYGLSVQDILIRYNRMAGKKALFLPGTDHAAIATQSKVEKEIQKTEKKSRHDLGREELLKRVDAFAKESHDTMAEQMKILGLSCDWSREAFTLDADRNLAVNTIFKKMYDDGLIYRGNRVVNWDPKGQTTISDDEIVYETRKAKLYTFKYSKDFPISISTTRPETKVGDTAVAVHPDDARYQEFIGQTFSDIDFCGVKINIKIVADKDVDPEFGTGALGVTPAHSQIDAEMAERHDLPTVTVINEYAKMSVGDDRLLGKKTTEAREIIVEWLKSENLLEKEEEIDQNIATAERTGGIIEPLPKLQWFVSVNKEFDHFGKKTTLKKLMQEAVSSNSVRIIPEHFDKTYFHWIDNLRDWCISRQIWYGHRVPVWYKGDELYCGIEAPKDADWTQDEDTLDTWFSSGLWTFSTLGWPKETNDLKTYHPTNVIVPAYEILFFWVARMIMMTSYALDQVPFRDVYLTGVIRDGQGRKFSKSLGNGIDPRDVAGKFGADAGRMALVYGTAPGTDGKISEDKIKAYKHFANKLWNITRFILESTEDKNDPTLLNENDRNIFAELEKLTSELTINIQKYQLHIVAEKLYGYAWHELADKLLEESKPILREGTDEEKTSRSVLLRMILRRLIILIHPFMPFVTEEIWGMIKNESDDLLIVTPWPSSE